MAPRGQARQDFPSGSQSLRAASSILRCRCEKEEDGFFHRDVPDVDSVFGGKRNKGGLRKTKSLLVR